VQILEEAQRLLKPGGALAIMDMNPYSPLLQRMVNNVFAFTVFKATEPYFDDYRTFGLENAIESLGFASPVQAESSPSHRTLVALKN
jgi:ubiquinone/menaquinone biosynthesis C-methylase UbiE